MTSPHYRICIAALSCLSASLMAVPGMASPDDTKKSPVPLDTFLGTPITMEIQNEDLYSVLRDVFSQQKVNYTIDPSLKRVVVSAKLQNVPFQEALKSVLKASNMPFAYRVQDGVYSIVLQAAKQTPLSKSANSRTAKRNGNGLQHVPSGGPGDGGAGGQGSAGGGAGGQGGAGGEGGGQGGAGGGAGGQGGAGGGAGGQGGAGGGAGGQGGAGGGAGGQGGAGGGAGGQGGAGGGAGGQGGAGGGAGGQGGAGGGAGGQGGAGGGAGGQGGAGGGAGGQGGVGGRSGHGHR